MSTTTAPKNVSPATPPNRDRIQSLDGLRALSIVLVLYTHVVISPGYPFGGFLPFDMPDFGNFGVRIFFVISGFLITTLLMEEHRSTGAISIRDFYIRRTFRILPAFLVSMAAILWLYWSGRIKLMAGDLLHSFTFTVNFFDKSHWVGHLWSLSVEEQFYLIWPAALVLGGMKRARTVAGLVIVAAPLLRLLTYYLDSSDKLIRTRFYTVADALAFGCLLALMRADLLQTGWYRRLLESRWFWLVPLSAVLVQARLIGRPRLYALAGVTLMNASIALSIDWCMRNSQRLGVLNAAPMVYLGRISYSLYLWQQLLLIQLTPAFWTVHFFPWNLLATMAAGALSYEFIEKPALRFRSRWIASKGAVRQEVSAAGLIQAAHR